MAIISVSNIIAQDFLLSFCIMYEVMYYTYCKKGLATP